MTCYEIDGIVPVIDPTAFVHPDAVLIGDVIIGPGSYIGPLASLRGDFGRISVGAGANVQDCCVVHSFPAQHCSVDDEGHIAHGAVLHGCRVGRGTMVGMNAVVMDGVVLGERSLVAANSFVPAGMQVPDETLVAGTPAKIVRSIDATMQHWQANGIRVYQALAQRSLASLRPVMPLTVVEPDRGRVSTDRSVSIPLHELRGEPGR